MNKVLLSLLFSVFFLTGSSFAQAPTPPAAPAAPAAPAVATAKPPAHHHHSGVRAAIHKLIGAKHDLANIPGNGDISKAIADINQAIAVLKAVPETK